MTDKQKVFTQDDIAEGKKKIHPNSLANLKPRHDQEHMKKMLEKRQEARIKQKESREAMKEIISLVNALSEDLIESVPQGLTIMKIAMLKAMSTDDMAEASRLAAIIAEYEQPKLQRTENINTNFDFTDLTDEELAAEMARLNS